MAAPTQPANMKIALANSERSTHGTSATSSDVPSESAMRAKADISARLVLASIGYGWRAAVLPVQDHPAMLATKAYVHIADFANAKAYLEEPKAYVHIADFANAAVFDFSIDLAWPKSQSTITRRNVMCRSTAGVESAAG